MKKNIVIVVSAMNMGGAQRVVSILSDHWAKNRYVVTLISTFTEKTKSHFQINKNVTLKYLTDSPIFSKKNPLNLLWKLICLRREIKSQNPDVVISFLARVNLATALSTIGMKTSLIMCERTWPPFASLNNKFLWIYKVLFKRANKIIVQTQKSKIWMTKNFPDTNVKVIPNPITYPIPVHIKQSVSPNSLILQNRKVILASGRMVKFKQFDLLIKAFYQIKDKYQGWDLVILGDGEEKDTLKKLLLELGIADRVFFPGKVGNISEWYKRADIFVLSSSVEGFPNVLLEAMSYGVPSISFDCDTGPSEMIQNGINGILVEPDDRELGLVRALNKLILSKELRNKFSCNSILLREKYSIKNIMQEWDKVLHLQNLDK